MSLETVAAALRAAGAKEMRAGSETKFTCPLHRDQRPSLTLREGRDGGVVVKCFPCEARYDTNRDYVTALISELGLSWTDFQPPAVEPRIVAEYRYENGAGRYLFSVLRYEPKDFRQHIVHALPDGGMTLEPGGLGGIRPVPFRLPKLKAALTSGSDIYICEGEEDVLALVKRGHTATCNPGGAGKWLPEFSEHFKDSSSRVIVVPDWDAPEKGAKGQQHALHVAASLAGGSVRVEFRRAARGKDVRDHLAAGHAVDALVTVEEADLQAAIRTGITAARNEELSQRAEELVFEQDARARAAELRAERSGYTLPSFTVLRPQDLALPVEPLSFLVEGVWLSGSHGVVGARKKTLKSYFVDALALAVATGKPGLGQFAVPAGPQPVFVFVGEGSARERTRRLQRMARDLYGCDLDDTLLHLAEFAAPLGSDAFKNAVGKVRRDLEPALIVLDALYAFHPPGIAAGNLYERGPMLFELSATVGRDTALIVVDHFNKTAHGLDLDAVAQAGIAQWVESWILLDHTRPPDPVAGRFHLRAEVGSRDWGASSLELDWAIGRMDISTGTFSEPLRIEVREATSSRGSAADHKADRIRATTLQLLDHQPRQLTKSKIREHVKQTVGCGQKAFDEVWENLVAAQAIRPVEAPRSEGAKTRTRDLWERDPTPQVTFQAGAGGDAS